jgi:hypothetical protein
VEWLRSRLIAGDRRMVNRYGVACVAVLGVCAIALFSLEPETSELVLISGLGVIIVGLGLVRPAFYSQLMAIIAR